MKNSAQNIVNGEEKVKILLAEGLIKLTEPKPVEEEAPAEEASETAEAEDEPEEASDE